MHSRIHSAVKRQTERIAILRVFLESERSVVRRETLIEMTTGYRRIIRQLQQEEGWSIVQGQTILDMIEIGDLPADDTMFPGISTIGPDDYLLTESEPDPDAPRRWAIARQVRARFR
jgi:hypothetical protein